VGLRGEVDRLRAVRGLADDLHPGGRAQQGDQSAPHQELVVDDQDPDRLFDVACKAGPKTLGVADWWLVDNGDGTVTYLGYKHDVTFKRSGGKYYVKVDKTKGWKLASYNTLNVV